MSKKINKPNPNPIFFKNECTLLCKVEYITKDGFPNNIVLGISKRTKADILFKILQDFEGQEVSITISPKYNGKHSYRKDNAVKDTYTVKDTFFSVLDR